MRFSKVIRRRKIHWRVRENIKGTSSRPRISVFRSNNGIYCQLIDDRNGNTLVAASSLDKGFAGGTKNKTEQAREVGRTLAEKAQAANISQVVFDRSGYLYHGRVKALAEGAREGGLKF
ncbi:MAG: 50S ribosomal protein L18 [Saprospiraceae bacterium]|nr:MAG: 50S ribosomal protein L18 [Saprospiraceae bacterium]